MFFDDDEVFEAVTGSEKWLTHGIVEELFVGRVIMDIW